MLFNDAPKALLERVEQVVRLIRSKGVGVYFVTQNPSDIPDTILGQLGNRIQHALRAYTPRDQKAVRTAAQTMRPNPELDVEAAITHLGVGEALLSTLDEKGIPGITQQAWMHAPGSRIGPATEAEKSQLRAESSLGLKYDTTIDRESAYEVLEQRIREAAEAQDAAENESGGLASVVNDWLFGSTGPRGGKRDGLVQSVLKSELRRGATKAVRGVLGSLLKAKR